MTPDEDPNYIDYEVTYPLGFLVSVPKDASRAEIIEAYMQSVQDWVQDGAMPATEAIEIERVNLHSPETIPIHKVRPGDVLDLENDLYADPNGESEFHINYEEMGVTVWDVEQETDNIIRLDFTETPSVGFPRDHEVRYMGRDVDFDDEMPTDNTMLAHHLQNNFFPPYDVRLVPYCQIAIERAEAGDWDAEITIKGDAGEKTVTVSTMVEDFRLHDFMTAHGGHDE